jgi:hypothetical protein
MAVATLERLVIVVDQAEEAARVVAEARAS